MSGKFIKIEAPKFLIKDGIDKILIECFLNGIIFFFKELDKKEFKTIINIPLEVYDKLESLKITTFKDSYKHSLTFKKEQIPIPFSSKHSSSLKQNLNTSFQDSTEGRMECLSLLHKKIKDSDYDLNICATSGKHLIYYSIYFNKGYTDLLNYSVESLLKNGPKNYDILLITDESTKQLIEKLPVYKDANFLFHLTPTPEDGVEASKNKTLIYDYEFINLYEKILFLDCDTVAVDNIDILFKKELKPEILYTAHNLNLNYKHFKSIFHGFETLSDEFVEEMIEAQQFPFNAGQFLFVNSSKMKTHFNNLRWFMREWPSEYFYEQCFMCYYFCKAKITESSFLHHRVSIISTVHDTPYNLKESCILHFVAPPLEAKPKIDFMKNFIENLKKSSKSSFFGLLKKLITNK